MDNVTTSWGDFLQNAAGQVLGTGLKVYQAKNTPMVSIDPFTGQPYVDGNTNRPPVAPVQSIGGIPPMLLLIGAAVLFVVLK